VSIQTTTTTGAELKVRLTGLGISPGWFAEQCGVAMRTVVRWFDGGFVEAKVEDLLEELSALTVKSMMDMLDEIDEETKDEEGSHVTLLTYRTDAEFASKFTGRKTIGSIQPPASWHRALTFRVWEHLRASGHEVSIEYR